MAYDPVYAHEYYMKHRKLKGRRKRKSSNITKRESSTGLSKEARAELKAYAAELKEKLAEEKEDIQAAKEAAIDEMNDEIMTMIEALQKAIKSKGISKAQKDIFRDNIKELRAKKTAARKQIVAEAKEEYRKARDNSNKAYNNKVKSLREKKG